MNKAKQFIIIAINNVVMAIVQETASENKICSSIAM